MSKIIFDSLAELLAAVTAPDDRSALIVKYRGKDYFALASDEDSALAAVAREMKFEVGNVPLDLIVAAIRGGAPTTAVAKDDPDASPKWALESRSVAEVREVAKGLSIDFAGLQKTTLISKIREADESYREPSA